LSGRRLANASAADKEKHQCQPCRFHIHRVAPHRRSRGYGHYQIETSLLLAC
jgi:hypothetical protein